jgi:hypothetical protein
MSSRSGRRSLWVVFAASLFIVVGLVSSATAPAATLPVISISVTPSSVSVSGNLISGGANVAVTGTGVKEATAIVFLLKPGVTVAEAEALNKEKKANHDPNNNSRLGAIVFDAEARSGHSSELQANLQPGKYVVLVSEGENGESKLRTSFTVAASSAPVALPAPQAKIRAIEFGFKGPATLHDGELVGFENEGFLVHMNIAFPVKNKKDAKQVIKLLLAGKEKALEKLIAGPPVSFTGPVSSGAYQQETITAKPGLYVEACFMNTQDGREHTRLGMERLIKITK